VAGVERQESRSRAEHSQDGHQQLDVPVEEQPDQ
jgi:hypothetical protein